MPISAISEPIIHLPTGHFDLYGQIPKLYCINGKNSGKKTISGFDRNKLIVLLHISLQTQKRDMLSLSSAAELINSKNYNLVWETLISSLSQVLFYFPKQLSMILSVFKKFQYLNTIKRNNRIATIDLRNHQEVRNTIAQTVGFINSIWSDVRQPFPVLSDIKKPNFTHVSEISYNHAYQSVIDSPDKNIVHGGYEETLIVAISQAIEPNIPPSRDLMINRLYWVNYLYQHQEYKIQPMTKIKKITKSIKDHPIWGVWKFIRTKINPELFQTFCEIGSWFLTRKSPETQEGMVYLTATLIYIVNHSHTTTINYNHYDCNKWL